MIGIQCSEKVKKKMRRSKVKYKKKRIEQLYLVFGILLFKILINYIVKL